MKFVNTKMFPICGDTVKCTQNIDTEDVPGHLGPSTASKSGTSWDVPGYPRTPWTWDSGT